MRDLIEKIKKLQALQVASVLAEKELRVYALSVQNEVAGKLTEQGSTSAAVEASLALLKDAIFKSVCEEK